ncbi:hypothetical protein VKT23_016200 [Stygiomarasmius scandens]|uniref:DNA 3'-5' helicase n=1 Tax=Marasmiellus scandens TaxID=2682957 RepID=A0ABR1IVQ7_9AGAR
MRERYTINAVYINEDTPQDNAWWTDKIFDPVSKQVGWAEVLIVTAEQLFRSKSDHLSHMGDLIRTNTFFQRKIGLQVIDEIHETWFSGIGHYGLEPFRPSWGKLSEIQRRLPINIPTLGLTATCPSHILPIVASSLGKPNYKLIQNTVNRHNIIYATHCVLGNLSVAENYSCFVSKPFNSTFQPQWQGKGVVGHYHSDISEAYKNQVHNAFTTPGGICWFLVSTSAESTGIDFPDVDIVVNIGLPPNTCDAIQRAGRVVHRDGKHGLFLILYEPWVFDINLSDYSNVYLDDPDRPRKALSTHSSRQDHAPFYLVMLVRGSGCLRIVFGNYLSDIAEEYTGPFCCDRHGDGFRLQDFLPSKIYSQTDFDHDHPPKPPAKRNQYCPTEQREVVVTELKKWRRVQHLGNPYRAVFPEWTILSDKDIENISKLKPCKMHSIANMLECLQHEPSKEWQEKWGEKLLGFLFNLNAGLGFDHTRSQAAPSVAGQKRKADIPLPSSSPSKRLKISAQPNLNLDSPKPHPKPRPIYKLLKNKEN